MPAAPPDPLDAERQAYLNTSEQVIDALLDVRLARDQRRPGEPLHRVLAALKLSVQRQVDNLATYDALVQLTAELGADNTTLDDLRHGRNTLAAQLQLAILDADRIEHVEADLTHGPKS